VGQERQSRWDCGGDMKTYPGKFKHFGGQVLEYGSNVNSCLGADAHLILGVLLEKPLDAPARELSNATY
jgi:hypothetical protein